MGIPEAESHNRTAWFSLPLANLYLFQVPVTIVRPSGLKDTDPTSSRCSGGPPMDLPVATSQSRAVPSALPVTTCLLLVLKAAVKIAARCASESIRVRFLSAPQYRVTP